MTNVILDMNSQGIADLVNESNRRPKVRFEDDVMDIGDDNVVDIAVEKANDRKVFDETKKLFQETYLIEKQKHKKKKKKKKSKSKSKKREKSKKHAKKEKLSNEFPNINRDSPANWADYAAGPERFDAQKDSIQNHAYFFDLLETKSNTTLEDEGFIQFCPQKEYSEHRYSTPRSSKISELRLKIKMMEKDRESLRSSQSSNEEKANNCDEPECKEEDDVFQDSQNQLNNLPNSENSHGDSCSKRACERSGMEIEKNFDNKDPFKNPSVARQTPLEAEVISERKDLFDCSSVQEKDNIKRNGVGLKKPPPPSPEENEVEEKTEETSTLSDSFHEGGGMKPEAQRRNGEKDGNYNERNTFLLSPEESRRISDYDVAGEKIRAEFASATYENASPGAHAVAAPVGQGKTDNRVGAFYYENRLSLAENSSPSDSDMSNEKIRTEAAAESYGTDASGAFADGLNVKKAKGTSFSPSTSAAAENYLTSSQLKSGSTSAEDLLRLQSGYDQKDGNKLPTITAFEVHEDDIENSIQRESVIRQQIIEQSVQAVEVVNDTKTKRKRRCLTATFLFVIIAIVLALALSLAGDKEIIIATSAPSAIPSSSPSETILPTLEQIAIEGKVRCGVHGDSTGFSKINNETGLREGFDADLVCVQF